MEIFVVKKYVDNGHSLETVDTRFTKTAEKAVEITKEWFPEKQFRDYLTNIRQVKVEE